MFNNMSVVFMMLTFQKIISNLVILEQNTLTFNHIITCNKVMFYNVRCLCLKTRCCKKMSIRKLKMG